MKYFCFLAETDAVNDVRWWLDSPMIDLVDDPSLADAIIVAGGDGTMLHAIHSLWQNDRPFIGINRGTVGFLLNPIESEEAFHDLIANFRAISLSLMAAEIVTLSGEAVTYHAFNDVYLNVRPGSICYGSIEGGEYPREEFRGDGLIIATPQGSTAYNRNAGGSILPLQDNLLAITTICAARPLRNVISKQDLTVSIERGEVTVSVDNQSIDAVKSIVIRPNHGRVALGFSRDYNFEKTRYSFYNKY